MKQEINFILVLEWWVQEEPQKLKLQQVIRKLNKFINMILKIKH